MRSYSDEVYNYGYNKGYDIGFADGHSTGFEDGYKKAREEIYGDKTIFSKGISFELKPYIYNIGDKYDR